MRIVCLSDTHGAHDSPALAVPDGDVLLHAGDMTGSGSLDQVEAFGDWLRGLPHPTKVVIAGNHDFAFECNPERALRRLGHGRDGVVYLQDGATVVGGLNVYGSPWQPRFFDWAFNLDRGAPLAAKWALIPEDIDILVTHGPPHGLLDRNTSGHAVGCEALGERLSGLTRLRLHVFGHIHEARGVVVRRNTTFVNASALDEHYRPFAEAPIVIDL
jgi:predicted phosphodiesterase